MIIAIFVGIKNETTKLFKMNCRMETLKKVWLIVFISLVGATSLWAQTDAELKFLAKADSLTTQLLNAYNGKDYPAAETFCHLGLVCDAFIALHDHICHGHPP